MSKPQLPTCMSSYQEEFRLGDREALFSCRCCHVCVLAYARFNCQGFPAMSTCKRWDCHKSPFMFIERKIRNKYTWAAHPRLNQQGSQCKLDSLAHSKHLVRPIQCVLRGKKTSHWGRGSSRYRAASRRPTGRASSCRLLHGDTL